MNENTKKIAEYFPCDYQVFEKGGNPVELEAAYYDALTDGAKKGFYPAILVADETVMEQFEFIFDNDYHKEKLIAECGDNGKKLLQERFNGYLEDYSEDFDEGLEDFIGNETEGDTLLHFSGYISFEDHDLEDDTLLLKIPAKYPWEMIAWLPMGGWNECPSPEEMIAVCKYWFEAYGAIPAVFTHDVMEFYAPKKLNNADSLEVAKEHYAFCVDRIDQGTRTGKLSELSAGLKNSKVWYFWWD